MRIFALLLLAGFALQAQAPTITDALRAKFWRAQAEYIAVSVQAQRAKDALDAVQRELTQACGKLALVSGQDGEPTCKEAQ